MQVFTQGHSRTRALPSRFRIFSALISCILLAYAGPSRGFDLLAPAREVLNQYLRPQEGAPSGSPRHIGTENLDQDRKPLPESKALLKPRRRTAPKPQAAAVSTPAVLAQGSAGSQMSASAVSIAVLEGGPLAAGSLFGPDGQPLVQNTSAKIGLLRDRETTTVSQAEVSQGAEFMQAAATDRLLEQRLKSHRPWSFPALKGPSTKRCEAALAQSERPEWLVQLGEGPKALSVYEDLLQTCSSGKQALDVVRSAIGRLSPQDLLSLSQRGTLQSKAVAYPLKAFALKVAQKEQHVLDAQDVCSQIRTKALAQEDLEVIMTCAWVDLEAKNPKRALNLFTLGLQDSRYAVHANIGMVYAYLAQQDLESASLQSKVLAQGLGLEVKNTLVLARFAQSLKLGRSTNATALNLLSTLQAQGLEFGEAGKELHAWALLAAGRPAQAVELFGELYAEQPTQDLAQAYVLSITRQGSGDLLEALASGPDPMLAKLANTAKTAKQGQDISALQNFEATLTKGPGYWRVVGPSLSRAIYSAEQGMQAELVASVTDSRQGAMAQTRGKAERKDSTKVSLDPQVRSLIERAQQDFKGARLDQM